jgi:Na+-transporting NADH:ubiquinone oxidoreductase subunit B
MQNTISQMDNQALERRRSPFVFLRRVLKPQSVPTAFAPHIRDTINTAKYLNAFVLASLPCWLIGLWNIGEQVNFARKVTGLGYDDDWRLQIMEVMGFSHNADNVLDCFLLGFLYFLPIFATAYLVAAFWEWLFARQRNKPIDEGLFSIVWFYCLILPATTSMLMASVGITFGIVAGRLIFGGAGRYLVNPSVLGFAFLMFSYSALVFDPGAWIPVPNYDEPTTVELFIDEGGIIALTSVNYTWQQLFIGNQPAPMGVSSVLGCVLGAIYLLVRGIASWRIMLGSLLGMIGSVLIFNNFAPDDPLFSLPWYWHAVIGGWAFGTVFLATDPVAAPYTPAGKLLFGLSVGAITIVVRLTNPGYYEGVIFAILLASIFSPMFDYVFIERNVKRRLQRTGANPV